MTYAIDNIVLSLCLSLIYVISPGFHDIIEMVLPWYHFDLQDVMKVPWNIAGALAYDCNHPCRLTVVQNFILCLRFMAGKVKRCQFLVWNLQEDFKKMFMIAQVLTLKVVLQGSPRSPDIHDLGECHYLDDLGRHTEQPSYIKATPGCQKSSPSY